MINRNKELENKLVNLLEQTAGQTEKKEEQAMIVNSMIALYKATDEKEYVNKAKQMLDKYTADKDATNTANTEDAANTTELAKDNKISKYLWGNAFYNIGDYSGDSMYIDKAVELAACFHQQPRNKIGYFSNNSESEEMVLSDFYCTQPFYMNYDTRNGGKEHYNDIIAQYNAVSSVLFDSCKNLCDEYVRPYDLLMKNSNEIIKKIKSDKSLYEAFVYYAASLIDTMELMAQPLYEIYRKLQEYYKVAVTLLLQSKTQENVQDKSVYAMLSYVILKGCRMKALLTEKYEHVAVELLEKIFHSISTQDQPLEAKYVAAASFAYSEWIRNREYQDYGINKGGVLWS